MFNNDSSAFIVKDANEMVTYSVATPMLFQI